MSGIDNILALSALHETETGHLNRESLTKMLEEAFHSATAAAGKDGYLIAFDQNADYDSENFHWFKSRYDRFVYVDRIVVANQARGRGLAREFYAALFARAKAKGHSRVVCEVNIDPPNPGSLAFHAALGFAEIGQATLENGKSVSYQERAL
jgi:uncharacterized protein